MKKVFQNFNIIRIFNCKLESEKVGSFFVNKIEKSTKTMFNFSKKRMAFYIFLIVVAEVLFLHYFFDINFFKRSRSKKVTAYRLLSAKDLEEKGQDMFEEVFPQFNRTTTNFNDSKTSYALEIRPDFEEKEMFVLFMVNSVPENFERRHLIRTTWANTWKGSKKNGKATKSLYKGRGYPKLFSNCIFVVGLSNRTKYERRVAQEAEILGDIFRAGMEDMYSNVVEKLWKAYEWAMEVNTKYIFKVEDGVYVNIPRMINWLNNDEKLPEHLYAGYVVYRHPVEDDYERQQEGGTKAELEQEVLPNYCLGAFYIFSTNVLKSFVDSAKTTPRIQAGEDAYMGLITKENYVLPYNVGNSLFVLDGSHGALAIEYTEEKLKHSVCIGDQMKGSYITQMHERYVYIRRRIDGKIS